jgi:RimJ/RimL family protein N-acetyltransferase
VFSTSERAMKAYKKAGLEVEGVMHRACWMSGHWVDEIMMATLRKQWISDRPAFGSGRISLWD